MTIAEYLRVNLDAIHSQVETECDEANRVHVYGACNDDEPKCQVHS